ncbi:MAG: hypothetical protein ACE5GZ_03590 [Gammaproteobacteria bacterium]
MRRRIFGHRFQQQIEDDNRTISLFGNYHYLSKQPSLLASGHRPPINAYEFSYYSQNGEDGIMLHLLSRIGVESHYVVEIGIEDGQQCNSSNLILNFGWQACLIEAAEHWAEKARQYFSDCLAADRVRLVHATAGPENINALLQNEKVPKYFDVLSIDIDSYDYWLWEAVDSFIPRIVVIEYNASFGPSRSVTIPYGSLENESNPSAPFYHGASLSALQRLGKRKGYVLAGVDCKGVNAFFVRSDLALGTGIEAVEPARAFRSHHRRTKVKTVEEQYQELAQMPLTEIE